MNNKGKCFLRIAVVAFGFFLLFHSQNEMGTVYAAKISLNKKKVTIAEGSTYRLKLKNTKKTPKWSSNNKKIATVTSKGKVKAKAEGKAVITAKLSGKRYKCTVIVKKATAAGKKENDVCSRVNKERTKQGLSGLEMDAKLQKAAEKRAKEIAQRFDHTRPNGQPGYSVLDEYDIQYKYVGENIAAGYDSSKSVMQAWMGSPGHKSNILNAHYKKIGVGYYKSSKTPYKYYWVQLFTD